MKIASWFMVITFTSMGYISGNALANTYTVTNTGDSGAGSLRQAVLDANSNMMGPNTITFNIPTTDANYNSGTGVYTITLLSLLPVVQALNTAIDATTQPGNTNPEGPEICLRSTSNLMFGICLPLTGGSVKGFILQGFQMGVLITKYLSYGGNCTVSDCYIGVNYNGSSPAENNIGVAVYGGANNIVKNNLISGNITAGVGIRGANTNTIQGNKIGTDRTGMFRIPNYYGVAVDSSWSNLIGGNTPLQFNLISGNTYAGVAINTNISHDNNIKGNYIGSNLNCAARADTIANYYGIAINESYNNIIGGSTAAERNIISGNSESGIAIMGSHAKNNIIKGNYIGTNAAGTDSIPNTNGILLSGSSDNTIGGSTTADRNIISGNTLAGIAMAYTGTRNNSIKGNFIGVDYQGTQILGNYAGIYIKSNANSNIVGGSTAGERNIISGNYEMGIAVEAADSNIIKGNYIGPDVSGTGALRIGNDSMRQANGLLFNSTAKYNIAGGYNPGEGNVISGNRIYGHDIYGNSSYNSTIGNYIGVDATGNVAMPNATGVCVDGGANHNPFINNVFSGNTAYGIFIVTTGTGYNELRGNIFGLNAAGTDTVPNQSGLLLGGGTKHNIVGGPDDGDRNIISGNRFDGIMIADTTTMYNDIIGNYIGTDISGTIAKPNQIGLAIATKPSKNNVENNVISGNNYIGLIIFEHCDSNKVFGNKIGLASDGSPLGNGGAGIVISRASKYNIIGSPGKGNTIANNDTAGVVVIDDNTIYNTISSNIITNNGVMGIDLYPYGVNNNDAGDVDPGSNEKMNYPVIQNLFLYLPTGETTITGNMDYTINGGPEGIRLEFFKSDGGNLFHHGDAIEYLGFTTIEDNTGNWFFRCTGLNSGDLVTATATDLKGNTSEFSSNSSVVVGIQELFLNSEYGFFPNPASDNVSINFTTSYAKDITINLYSITGQKIANLANGKYPKGTYSLNYNLVKNGVTAGVYFIGVVEDKVLVRTEKLIITE